MRRKKQDSLVDLKICVSTSPLSLANLRLNSMPCLALTFGVSCMRPAHDVNRALHSNHQWSCNLQSRWSRFARFNSGIGGPSLLLLSISVSILPPSFYSILFCRLLYCAWASYSILKLVRELTGCIEEADNGCIVQRQWSQVQPPQPMPLLARDSA